MNGFNEAIEAVYLKAKIQRCIMHQIRSSLRYVSWKDRKAVASDLKMIYATNPIESLNSSIKRHTKSKGSFPTIDAAFKVLYLSTQEVQKKWNRNGLCNWSEIYP